MDNCTFEDVPEKFSPSEVEEISEELKSLGVRFRVKYYVGEMISIISIQQKDYPRFEEARRNIELRREALQKAENERKLAEENIKQQEIQRQEQIRKELEKKALKRRKEYER
jgi:hypothetical protein